MTNRQKSGGEALANYSIHVHQHRFSAWAAARAASVKGRRFSVEQCVKWLEAVGIDEKLHFEGLPEAAQFDVMHRIWRRRLINAADTISAFSLSHGQAAKILNCYLKARFINVETGGLEKTGAIHPPIDRLLLNEMIDRAELDDRKKRALKSARDKGWSALGEDEYEVVVALLKGIHVGEPLWAIERYWRGFQ